MRPPEGEIINVYVRVHHYPTSYSQESFKFEKYESWSVFFLAFFFFMSECPVHGFMQEAVARDAPGLCSKPVNPHL